MRVLWLSNAILFNGDRGDTGTWLAAMAHRLVALGGVTLGNISSGNVARLTSQDCGAIKQWIVPEVVPSSRDGLPSRRVVADILKAVDEFSPEVVHVWGTESYWGLLTARKLIDRPSLLEMQGLELSIARVFNGGLSFREQLACIGLKELLRKSSIFDGKRRFENWGVFEKEMISSHHSISTQSRWMEAQVEAIKGSGNTFRVDRVLREPFYKSPPWQFSGKPVVFCSAAYSGPFKGLHVAIRAVAIVKDRLPDIQVHIAGTHQRNGIRRDGYIAWVSREIKSLGIEHNVQWLGPLSAIQIVEELRRCSAFVLPTFIESYSVALAEAMMLGVPAVASYTGGIPCLCKDEESALFFTPGDEVMCAYQLERLLTDRQLAVRLSRTARAIATERNGPEKIVSRQFEIYRQVIADGSGGTG